MERFVSQQSFRSRWFILFILNTVIGVKQSSCFPINLSIIMSLCAIPLSVLASVLFSHSSNGSCLYWLIYVTLDGQGNGTYFQYFSSLVFLEFSSVIGYWFLADDGLSIRNCMVPQFCLLTWLYYSRLRIPSGVLFSLTLSLF